VLTIDRAACFGLWASPSGPVLYVNGPTRGSKVRAWIASSRNPGTTLPDGEQACGPLVGRWDDDQAALELPIPFLPPSSALILHLDNYSWAMWGDGRPDVVLNAALSMPEGSSTPCPSWLTPDEPFRRVPRLTWAAFEGFAEHFGIRMRAPWVRRRTRG
jgi:hypothetical protein